MTMREKKGHCQGLCSAARVGHGKYKYKSINGPLLSS